MVQFRLWSDRPHTVANLHVTVSNSSNPFSLLVSGDCKPRVVVCLSKEQQIAQIVDGQEDFNLVDETNRGTCSKQLN